MMRGAMRAAAIGGVAALIALAATARVRPAQPSSASIRLLDTRDVIRQHGADDCGIAAIAMLLRATGAPVAPDRLWAEFDPNPRGQSLRDLMTVAGRHGVVLEPVFSPHSDHAAVRPPWIAHLSWNHYVLVESDTREQVVVADPRGARYVYTADAFARAWSGHGLRLPSRPN